MLASLCVRNRFINAAAALYAATLGSAVQRT